MGLFLRFSSDGLAVARACLKVAFCKMCVPLCVQIAGMNFQTRFRGNLFLLSVMLGISRNVLLGVA